MKKTNLSVYLDPELMPYAGRQYPSGKSIFGLLADSSPDRWGRVLMNKRERILAEKEGRKPAKLYDSDYLLGVYDETRMGGLRFKSDPDGEIEQDRYDNDNDDPDKMGAGMIPQVFVSGSQTEDQHRNKAENRDGVKQHEPEIPGCADFLAAFRKLFLDRGRCRRPRTM